MKDLSFRFDEIVFLSNYKFFLLHFPHSYLVPLYAPPITVVYVHESFFLFAKSFHPPPTSPHLAVILLSIYECVSILFVSLVCSLDFTYECNHMVLSFSDWLISLHIIFSRSIHTVTKGKISFFMAE